jgi:hypothetical protein
MSDIITIGSIDPLFYFWLAVWYLIILFHSWDIPVIWDKIKGVETLFIAGVLGYILTQLTRNFIFPVKDIISKTVESGLANLPLVDLPTIPGSGPGNDIINIVSIELFMLSFSIILFMGTIFFILWVLRYCLDPDGTIFNNHKRFATLDKLKMLTLGTPLLVILVSFVILILFEGLIGSILNIFKLPISFSSIIDLVYWILGIILGLIMLIILIPFITDYGKQIYAIIFAAAGKISQFYKNYTATKQSEDANIFLKNLFDRHRNEVFLFFTLWVIVVTLREYEYGRLSIIETGIYLLILISIIAAPFVMKEFRKIKKVV